MATLAVSPKCSICREKERLTGAFLRAVQEVMALDTWKLAAVASGAVEDLDVEIEQARWRRDTARRAYRYHQRVHGC